MQNMDSLCIDTRSRNSLRTYLMNSDIRGRRLEITASQCLYFKNRADFAEFQALTTKNASFIQLIRPSLRTSDEIENLGTACRQPTTN